MSSDPVKALLFMQLHSLSRHGGLSFDQPLDRMVQEHLPGALYTHNLLERPALSQRLDTRFHDFFWQRKMLTAFSIKPLVARIPQPSFRRSALAQRNKVILNGASGDRTRYRLSRQFESRAESAEWFAEALNHRCEPGAAGLFHETPGTVLIETKNFFNFYHFLAEALHFVALFASSRPAPATIRMLAKKAEVRPFVRAWIAACFPDLADRIVLESQDDWSARAEAPAYAAMSGKHLLYQLEGEHLRLIEEARPAGGAWTVYDARPQPVSVLALNSFDETLLELRRIAIAAASRSVRKRWGSRIYIARSADGARARIMQGEDELIARLSARGYETVYLEHMSPLEQVACINGARSIVAPHGAGMTNMIFASPEAHVHEIGTYQTALRRWEYFIPLCHVSQCHYHKIAVDMDRDDDKLDPDMKKDGHRSPVLSGKAIDGIEAILARHEGDDRPGWLAALANQCDYLMARGAFRQVIRLLRHHEAAFEREPLFWEKQAALNEAVGRSAEAAEHFHRAWTLSGSPAHAERFAALARPDDPRRSAMGKGRGFAPRRDPAPAERISA